MTDTNATRTWNQAAIDRWADETFGRAASAALIAARANQEMAELLLRLATDPNGMGLAIRDEAADVAIVPFRLAHVCRFDLLEAVERKMQINIGREWTSPGNGDGRHVPSQGGKDARYE